MAQPRVICLFGPTASGKTGAAIALAEKWNGEIINADSRQIYRHMPLIAASPSAEEYAAAPHHLFEFLDPAERFSAGAWAAMATGKIDAILAQGKTPIVVGGTGFYLKALMGGMDAVPEIPASAEAPFTGLPAAVLHQKLQQVDAPLAAKLLPTDTQRLTRALAVQAHTGTPLSTWQAQKRDTPRPYAFQTLALCPPRPLLHQRIALRWEMMKTAGVVEEALALRQRGYTAEMPGITGLGIVDLWDYLSGHTTWEQTTARVVAKTRQYAKRQITWLRHQYPAEYTAETAKSLVDAVTGPSGSAA